MTISCMYQSMSTEALEDMLNAERNKALADWDGELIEGLNEIIHSREEVEK